MFKTNTLFVSHIGTPMMFTIVVGLTFFPRVGLRFSPPSKLAMITIMLHQKRLLQPPTAAIPSNLSAPLTVSWTPEKHGDQYYLYSHFAEIQDLHANDTREFDVLWNGAVTVEAFVPSKLLIDTFMNKSPETCDGGKCSYQLIKTSKSTLPPLLNALEIYAVIQFAQSETDENDGTLFIIKM